MTRDEFLRRWEQAPGLKRAELIDGIDYMPSPISRSHGDFHVSMSYSLTSYAAKMPEYKSGIAGTWLMARTARRNRI